MRLQNYCKVLRSRFDKCKKLLEENEVLTNEGHLINNNQYQQPEPLADGQKLSTLSPEVRRQAKVAIYEMAQTPHMGNLEVRLTPEGLEGSRLRRRVGMVRRRGRL